MARTLAMVFVLVTIVAVFAWVRVDATVVQQTPGATVLDGAYTEAQALRGHDEYMANCARCHEGVCPEGPPLEGPLFVERWREDNLGSLLRYMTTQLPPIQGGGLPENIYLDSIAYLLQQNGYPTGSKELTAATASEIQLVGKNGPRPLPSNAPVQVVGCLAQDANGLRLVNATNPIRNRRGGEITPEELAAAEVQSAGSSVYVLQNVEDAIPNFKAESVSGKKLFIKGVLGRAGSGSRLFVTALEPLKAVCMP